MKVCETVKAGTLIKDEDGDLAVVLSSDDYSVKALIIKREGDRAAHAFTYTYDEDGFDAAYVMTPNEFADALNRGE